MNNFVLLIKKYKKKFKSIYHFINIKIVNKKFIKIFIFKKIIIIKNIIIKNIKIFF